MKELIAVSQKNKQNCTLCSILRFTGNFTSKNVLEKFQLLTIFTSRLVPVNQAKADDVF